MRTKIHFSSTSSVQISNKFQPRFQLKSRHCSLNIFVDAKRLQSEKRDFNSTNVTNSWLFSWWHIDYLIPENITTFQTQGSYMLGSHPKIPLAYYEKNPAFKCLRIVAQFNPINYMPLTFLVRKIATIIFWKNSQATVNILYLHNTKPSNTRWRVDISQLVFKSRQINSFTLILAIGGECCHLEIVLASMEKGIRTDFTFIKLFTINTMNLVAL